MSFLDPWVNFGLPLDLRRHMFRAEAKPRKQSRQMGGEVRLERLSFFEARVVGDIRKSKIRNDPAGGGLFYRFVKAILTPILKGLYHVRAVGLESFPEDGPVIVVANHVSFMDSLFIPLMVPRRMVYLAKAEYFESWKTAWFFKFLGMIPVKRDVKEKTEAALLAGLEVLEEEGVIGLYPEGTRSPDGRCYRGRTGVARLVMRSQARVVPVGLIGSRQVMPKEARWPKLWGHVTVRFGEPLDFSRYLEEPEDRFVLRTVTDEIMFEIMTLSGQTYVDEYASKEAEDVVPEDFRIPVEEMLG